MSRGAGCLTAPGSAEPDVDVGFGDTASQAAIKPPPANQSVVNVRVMGFETIVAHDAAGSGFGIWPG
jgi:hypothetical protein